MSPRGEPIPTTEVSDIPSIPKPVAILPIGELGLGPIAPPMEPEHPSWNVLEGWVDPLAPRAGYRVKSSKTRVLHLGLPAIEWDESRKDERALITGEPTWREYSAECRLQALQEEAGPTQDDANLRMARAGLVFRCETSRKFYYFCLEGKRRLVLYRRNDDEWTELASRDVEYAEEIVTLRIALDGDGITASSPELGAELRATDTFIPAGRVGFRAIGKCRLLSLVVMMTPSQQRINERLAAQLLERTAHLSAGLPDEKEAGEIDLSGDREIVCCADLRQRGRNDLLLLSHEGLIAESFDGQIIWQWSERPSHILLAKGPRRDGILPLYALVGERKAEEAPSVRGRMMRSAVADEIVMLDAATGRVLARAKLPEHPQLSALRQYDFGFETGPLLGAGEADFVVREWRSDTEGGGRIIWAYDSDLNMLWQRAVEPPYGHHNAVHLLDVNGDGRAEVMAGGTLLSSSGEVLAVHDLVEEMRRIFGAHHYDAVVVGNFAEDPELDPVAFMAGGSAGVYVTNPLTGRTRAVHRIGHAQWAMPCKLRDDLPGSQIMAGTRWANMGILTLFSGRGERLWSIQPDYILQGACPVQWVKEGPQHIWHNTTRDAFGLYDGFGRLVKRLDKMRARWGDRVTVQCIALAPAPAEPHLLGLRVDDRLCLYTAR